MIHMGVTKSPSVITWKLYMRTQYFNMYDDNSQEL